MEMVAARTGRDRGSLWEAACLEYSIHGKLECWHGGQKLVSTWQQVPGPRAEAGDRNFSAPSLIIVIRAANDTSVLTILVESM